MNPISIIGAFIITLSLLAYGMGSISLSRFKSIDSIVLIFLSTGVVFDLAAIVLMVLGAKGTPYTLHGFIGYIAFLIMLSSTIWTWRIYFKKGIDAPASSKHLKFAKFAYLWWVLAYITGSLIVLWR